jgi:hypothetical protein
MFPSTTTRRAGDSPGRHHPQKQLRQPQSARRRLPSCADERLPHPQTARPRPYPHRHQRSNKIQRFGVDGQGRSPNASDENKLAGREFLAGFSPEGEANHNAAVAASISDAPDVVIVLSDGSGEPMTGLELRKFNAANDKRAKIYAIEFGYGPPFGLGSFARQLAKENGGKTIYVDLLKK